jgi:hypothetical protein
MESNYKMSVKFLAIAASYAFAAISGALQIADRGDLLEFIRILDEEVKADLDCQYPSTGPRLRKLAEDFSRNWSEERQRKRQVAELEEKVKSLAESISKAEVEWEAVGSSGRSNDGKRKTEAEILSEIEELGIMAKKLKTTSVKSS